MDELLQEFVDSRGVEVRVDREHGVLRGVKLLGLDSRNGRKYSPAALDAAKGLYEGARVNVNHPKGHPLATRDYQDRLGLVRNIALRPAAGLFGDFHFNPKHALAEQLLWDAEHAPENVGFSHNVQARTVRHGEETLVETILKVHSVDLVADPATTCGLFEQALPVAATPTGSSRFAGLAGCTLDELRAARPDLVALIEGRASAELAPLRRRVDELQALEAVRGKRELARRLLAEFHLPDPDLAGGGREIVSESFVESLLTAADEAAMRDLVAQRARLLQAAAAHAGGGRSAARPLSREQGFTEATERAITTAESFARAIQ